MSFLRTTRDGTTNGTGFDDLIVVAEPRSNPSGDSIAGRSGTDVVFADMPNYIVDFAANGNNNTIARATNIDAASFWSVGGENPLVDDSSVPHATIIAQGDGQPDYFRLDIGAGETITVDIDFASGVVTDGNVWDTNVRILNGAGTVLAENDDAAVTLGGAGSFATTDSFVQWTNTGSSALTIYVNQTTGGRSAELYVMTVSVSGHAAANTSFSDSDNVSGENGDDFIMLGGGDDTANGNNGNDTVYGQAGDDVLLGRPGDDALFGGTGADTLSGGEGSDILDGGAGIDTVFYRSNIDGNGNAAVFVNLQTGQAIIANGDVDTITNVEVVKGTNLSDTIYLADLTGSRAEGFDGNDFLIGGAEGDVLDGGNGSDFLFWSAGDDNYDGGNGTDYVTFDQSASAVVVNLAAGSSNQVSFVGSTDVQTVRDVEGFFLSGGADTFTGRSGSNEFVFAGDGNDIINSGGGGDIIYGQGGDDFIQSGALTGLLVGGTGADTFYYAVDQLEQDQILDFTSGTDKIAFEDDAFNLSGFTGFFEGINFFTTTTAQGVSYGAGSAAAFYFTDTGQLYIDADGAGGSAATLIAALGANTTLVAGDLEILDRSGFAANGEPLDGGDFGKGDVAVNESLDDMADGAVASMFAGYPAQAPEELWADELWADALSGDFLLA